MRSINDFKRLINMKVESETAPEYGLALPNVADNVIIKQAQAIIKQRLTNANVPLTSSKETGCYLQVMLADNEHELFAMICLDNRNRPIAFREMFRGTIDGASIYPREVVKQALADNAAAVILAHNHPSGITEPSQADLQITERLKKALALVDIRVLDHVIVGEENLFFSERGLI